jgi:hypothetical protein
VEYSNCPKCGLAIALPEDGERLPERHEEKHKAMDVPLALLPASKRVEEQERGSSDSSADTNRVRRLLRRSQSRRSTSPSSDQEEHL